MNRCVCLFATLALALSGAAAAPPLEKMELAGPPSAICLPEDVSTPDGMTVGRDGRIYLNVLNLQVPAVAAVWTLDADEKLGKLIDLPKHTETGGVYPLGIAQGPDGDLYVADNQTFGGQTEHKSRLLRVVMDGAQAVRVETVASGFIAANAVESFGQRIYVTETCLVNGAQPHVSGVYGFDLDELRADRPVQLKPDGQDPRLVARFTTTAADWRKAVGANGMAISPDGRLFVCNFGEASILTAPLGEDGKLAEPLEVLVKGSGIGSTDGMKYVAQWNKLVVADFFSNAVHLVDAETGKVKTLAQDENSTGADGRLDKPSEPCVRGKTIYASNIDLPYDGNQPDKPDSLTVFRLRIKGDE
jgi:sugar lactone lactonase YvrE